MKHPFFGDTAPLVFAHRGGRALAPENTLAAFEQGLALGADGLELDVHLSRDGVVVVHHDACLDRTTNRTGPISECSAAELAATDAAYHFRRGATFPFRGRGIAVPSLAQVLQRFPGTRIIIELKTKSSRLAQAVVEVVQAAGATERVCVGSFHRGPLRVVRSLLPEVATSAARVEVVFALLRLWCRRSLAGAPYQGFQIPERSGRLLLASARWVAAAERAGLGVQVWTVDTAADANRLLERGVHALITDRPDVIVPLVRERSKVQGGSRKRSWP